MISNGLKDVEMKEEEEEEEEIMPFMDTFYSLASNEAKERSFAASSLIRHVFNINGGDEEITNSAVKDGCYAFKRLLNGLCSGRAGARQGFASCLASFLNLSFRNMPGKNETWMELFMKNMDQQSDMSAAVFVQKQLKESTHLDGPTKGKKNVGKRSRAEERDHRFGRLFGILAIVRSGTIVSASVKVLSDYVSDLLDLYNHKNWFREPAVHALKELFSHVSVSCSMNKFGELAQSSLLSFFNFENKSSCPWSVEKVALYLHLQTIYMNNGENEVPQCLERALLTVSNLDSDIGGGVLKIMLRDTSETVYPKCHLIWGAIWSYLSTSDEQGEKILRIKMLFGDDSTSNITKALVNKVIVENLLGDEVTGGSFVSATHGRRALGLSLIKQLCALNLSSTILSEVVLQQRVVTNLFVNTLQKFSSGKKVHTLKPLAINILQNIVETLCSQALTEESAEKRLGAAAAFLRANPSFDSVTKTETVSKLLELGLNDNADDDASVSSARKYLWSRYFEFSVDEVLRRLSTSEATIQEANKYIDIIFAFMKRILRIGPDTDEKEVMFQKVLSFFMIGAFFDLDTFDSKGMKDNVLLDTANRMKRDIQQIPYESRVVMSSRFFSLFSDYTHSVSFKQNDGEKERTKDRKIHSILGEVSFISGGVTSLQKHGALLTSEMESGEEASPVLGAMKECEKILELSTMKSDSDGEFKSISAIACLASALSLQLLCPGQAGPENDVDNDSDEEDISEDIIEIISDLSEVASTLGGKSPDNENDDVGGGKENILASLAAICVGILNSSIGGSGSQSSSARGGASKLVRECVQMAWTTILASSDNFPGAYVDTDVMNTLLEAVCSPTALAQGENEMDDEDMEDYEEDDEESGDESNDMELSFSKAASAVVDSDSDDASNGRTEASEDDTESMKSNSNKGEGEEIELDPSKLENLLIESSDDDDSVDENILEHHEGADAALAQLIKLKQNARKAGKDQREKLELADRIRCVSLIEAVFQSNKRTNTLSNQVSLMVVLPLLRCRSELAKAVSSAAIGKKGSSVSEKKVLLDKISALLESKVCKTNLDGNANVEACKVVAEQVIVELKRVHDSAHCKCCSLVLVFLVKAVSNMGDAAISFIRSIYAVAVDEWSTKKTTKIQATVFDELANRCQSIARMILTGPMVIASKGARNSYLKSESLRILSLLYHVQPTDDSQAISNLAELKENASSLSLNLVDALNDVELLKPKRIRDVFKAAERLVNFATTHGEGDEIWPSLEKLRNAAHAVAESDESSPAGVSLCKKLESDINAAIKLYEEKAAEAKKDIAAEISSPPSSKKKGKKKNKKKKKGKR